MIHWHIHQFDDLSSRQLYLLMQLRQDVFIVEQHCPFADMDNKDFVCWHLSAWRDNVPVAYARIVPPELAVANVPTAIATGSPSIGRVCNASSVRGSGIGRELMQRALQHVNAHWPGSDCQIGAQSYLRRFYESLGFIVNGDEYIEDGIPHFPMRWYAQQA